MKIVHSFWSKPGQSKIKTEFGRSDGGWLDRKYYYMSWALSCLLFRKLYDKVELVTDKAGEDLLVQKLDYLIRM
jgi:hypothetical protein